jgi:hypothetical protein
MVDHSALRTNQASIILLLLAGFVAGAEWIVALVAAVMLVGTFFPQAALFKQLYARVLKPAGLVKPDVKEEDPPPHNFAQAMGGAVLGIATTLLAVEAGVAGWALVWLVVALAALNLFAGFRAGCFIYYHLGRFEAVKR